MAQQKKVFTEYRVETCGIHSKCWGLYSTKAEAMEEYRELVQGEPEKHWRLIKTTWEEQEHHAAVER